MSDESSESERRFQITNNRIPDESDTILQCSLIDQSIIAQFKQRQFPTLRYIGVSHKQEEEGRAYSGRTSDVLNHKFVGIVLSIHSRLRSYDW